MTIQTIGVVGAGQMGSGIAQVAAAVEIDVVLVDHTMENLERARASIERSLSRLVKRESITQADADAALGRISFTPRIEDNAGADVVIEAVTEDFEVKRAIFTKLDAICASHTILATNTSSIPITRIASATNRADRVIGMHFMNPVPIMKLVEIIRGHATSADTLETTCALAERLGKTTVTAEDYPGFIVNRVLMPMINEACYALMEGVGSVEDIDTAMKLGTNQPMGPLTLADFIGLDTCLAIMNVLHEGFGDSKYRPCPLLRRYVDSGQLGRKTGRGFYTYPTT